MPKLQFFTCEIYHPHSPIQGNITANNAMKQYTIQSITVKAVCV